MDKSELKKNEEFETVIENFGMNGEGVCHYAGAAVFVPFTIPGEKVRVKIINVKSKTAIGKSIQILEPSADRVSPLCPYFSKCGGCDLQHLDYAKSLEFKRKEVEKNLKHIAKLDVDVLPCEPSEPYFYRNKCAFPVVSENGEVKIGMFRETSHKLIDINSCPVTKDFSSKLIEICKNYFNKYKISGYNEETGEGDVRHIVARMLDNFLMVTLVATKFDLPGLEYLYQNLSKNFNCSLWLNLNKQQSNVIFGEKFKHFYGENEHFCEILGLKVSVNPASFMQVNDQIRDKIYNSVLAEIEENEPVIDAFSGAGVMSAILSKKSKKVYAIEIVKEACQDAEKLAKINKIENLSIFCGDCTLVLPKIAKKLKGEKFSVVLDPPRKGCDSKVIDALSLTSPNKIIYVSCNSATLARDVRMLLDKNPNYKVKFVKPFDMFPQTRHIETLLVLEKY